MGPVGLGGYRLFGAHRWQEVILIRRMGEGRGSQMDENPNRKHRRKTVRFPASTETFRVTFRAYVGCFWHRRHRLILRKEVSMMADQPVGHCERGGRMRPKLNPQAWRSSTWFT